MLHHLAARSAFALIVFGVGFLILRLAALPFEASVPAPTRLLMGSMAALLASIGFIAAAIAGRALVRNNLAAWLGVGTAFIAIAFIDRDYDDWLARRVWADSPNSPYVAMENTRNSPIVLNRSPDGHYYVDAGVNGGRVTFLVDTGASMVAIDLDDARAVGIRPETLVFNIPVSTAAGQAMAAPVMIPTLDLAGHRFENVPALVIRGSGMSLLGMSILGQFEGLEIRQNQLVLRR